ncbi:MAG: AAA family ATPase [Candidatus Aenigmatarchaeota archaeon]|nr:AAA family ATPase [Candidatus Aenigmarchaeota archaeon]
MLQNRTFIVFEGAPSTGKTTHAKNLVGYLQQQGYDAVYVKMSPSEHFLGRNIIRLRRIQLPFVIEDPLYFIDAIREYGRIRAYLAEGKTVVTDKSPYNLLAFWNTFRNGTYASFMNNLVMRVFHNPVPDIIFYLTADYLERVRRSKERDPISKVDKIMLSPSADDRINFHLSRLLQSSASKVVKVDTTHDSIETVDSTLVNLLFERVH